MSIIRPGLSALAGQIIGRRKDGRAIRLAAGGSVDGTGDTGGDNGDNTGGDDQADKDGQGNADKTPKITGEFDPERHARALAASREAERKAKADAKAARDQVAAILKAAGLTPDGKTDPEEQLKALTARAEQAEQKARTLTTRDAVRTAAGKHSADADALLDSQRFLAQLGELDTEADDFGDKVADLVKAAVKANPKYAAAPPRTPGRQGADHSGGSGQGSRPKSLREAYARKNT